MRELGETTASLEQSHDLETHLLKGNRTLQEQSVECEQPKEEYRWLREELNVTWATLPVQCDITIDTPTQTICSEPDGKETEDLAQADHQVVDMKASKSCLEKQLGAQATLLAKALKTASRDKERVKMLSFQTELVKQLLAEKSFP
eukprot:Em0027g23a